MWLRLGNEELINMDHVVSVKKGDDSSLEIVVQGFDHVRTLFFDHDEDRDLAFEKLVDNLIKLREAMQ